MRLIGVSVKFPRRARSFKIQKYTRFDRTRYELFGQIQMRQRDQRALYHKFFNPKPSRMKLSILATAWCNTVALFALVHTATMTEAAEDMVGYPYGRRNVGQIVEGAAYYNVRRMKKSSTASSKDSSTKSSKLKSSVTSVHCITNSSIQNHPG